MEHPHKHHKPHFINTGLNTWARNFLRFHEATKNGEVKFYRDPSGLSHRLHTYHVDGSKFVEVVEWVRKIQPRMFFVCLKIVGVRKVVCVGHSNWTPLEMMGALRRHGYHEGEDIAREA